MAAPTIEDLFGAGATVDNTDPANPKLVVPFAGLANTGFTNTAKSGDSEGWFVAFIKRARLFWAAQTDELSNVEVDAPFKGTTTRNTEAKFEFAYAVRIYEPDPTASEPDPDNV